MENDVTVRTCPLALVFWSNHVKTEEASRPRKSNNAKRTSTPESKHSENKKEDEVKQTIAKKQK